MPYGICRVEKRKANALHGVELEINRDASKPRDFTKSKINWSLTDKNILIKKSDHWLACIQARCKALGIERIRKDATVMLDGVYTASPEFFENADNETITQYFKDCLNYHQRYYGEIINATIHRDETTIHLHVESIPLVHDGEKWKLSAKELMGGPKEMHHKQNLFFEEVSKKYNLERGHIQEANNRRVHLDTLEYKIQESEKILAELNENQLDYVLKLQDQIDVLEKELNQVTLEKEVFEEAVREQCEEMGNFRLFSLIKSKFYDKIGAVAKSLHLGINEEDFYL